MKKKKQNRRFTFRDSLGVRHRKNSKEMPQFGTIAEYDAWIADKKRATLAKRPNNVFNRAVPDPVADILNDMIVEMGRILDNEAQLDPRSTHAISGKTYLGEHGEIDSPR